MVKIISTSRNVERDYFLEFLKIRVGFSNKEVYTILEIQNSFDNRGMLELSGFTERTNNKKAV